MHLRELKQLIESTSDPAFAVDGAGLIAAWNQPAEAMFGITASETVGKPCGQVLRASDECGAVCSRDCTVRQAIRTLTPVANFDLQVQTKWGATWSNVSVLTASVAGSPEPYSIHILRPIDPQKRLELAVRDFVVTRTGLAPEQARAMIAASPSPAAQVSLTPRETEILRLLAKGATTGAVAAQLHISRTTVNNHTQHILRKLNAHSRLEAIRRAEHAGLI